MIEQQIPKLPKKLEETLVRYHTAPEPSAEFAARLELELRQKMKQNQTKTYFHERNTFMTTLRARPVLAILIALLILLALSGVTYAIGRSLGYIPGVGMVEQGSSLRILEEPLTVENANIRLTIEQVVAGPDKTLVVFHYIAPPFDPSMYQYQSPMDPTGTPALIMPDGSRLDITMGKRIAGAGAPTDQGTPVRFSWEFPPLANDIAELTLELPDNLPLIPPGASPKNWQIPLKLIPAPDGFVLPVFEVETNEADNGSGIETAPSHGSSSASADTLHGITTSLDMVVPLEEGYLLIGSMQWSEKDYPAGAVKSSGDIHLTDATGAEVPFQPLVAPDPELPQNEDYRSYWGVKVLSKNFAPPLKITTNDSYVDMYENPFMFQFDPGANPVLGQSWDIDQDFQIGDIQARILTATLTTYGGDPHLVFEYVIQARPIELLDVSIGMNINRCMGGGGSYPSEPSEVIQMSAYTCRTDLPPGPLDASVSGAVIWGPWQVEWTPPETTAVVSPTPTAASSIHTKACLTGETWQQALSKNEPIPSNLTGTLVLADPYEKISIVNLASGEKKVIGNGSSPSISPDGSFVAVTGPIVNSQPPNGLNVIDPASRNSTLLPGTTAVDSSPLWSPDGRMIAFTRGLAGSTDASGPYQVMVMNADGSNLRQLTSDNEEKLATAWMPDSLHIVYIARHGLESASVRMVNSGTGEISPLFEIGYSYGSVVISPDGRWAAYEDWLPGDIYALFVSSLDGSNRRLLAQGPEVTVVTPQWSPDGKWIIVSVFDDNSDSKLALIQADTCQIIPLRNLTGYVGSWIP